MKITHLCALALALPVLPLAAQQTGGEFAAPGTARDIREVRPAGPDETLPPKTHGVIVMMSEHGLQVINPGAPAKLGKGEKVLTRNIAHESPRVSSDTTPAPPFGGIQLFGWIF